MDWHADTHPHYIVFFSHANTKDLRLQDSHIDIRAATLIDAARISTLAIIYYISRVQISVISCFFISFISLSFYLLLFIVSGVKRLAILINNTTISLLFILYNLPVHVALSKLLVLLLFTSPYGKEEGR